MASFSAFQKKKEELRANLVMSAAPSNITWEDWTPRHLDQTTPVVSGLDQDLIPRFWQNGSVLVWDYYPECGFPIMLSGNKLVTDKDNGMVFSVGGIKQDVRTDQDQNDPIEVFRLCVSSGDYTWERVDSTSADGEVPEARFGHCCSYYNGKIYMYGGRNRQRYQVFGSQGSVLTYEIASGIWQEIATLVEDCDYPMARYGSACTTNGPIMYIHGGHVQYGTNKWGFTSELISFNMETRTWRIESPHFSKHPPPTQLEAVVGKPQNYLFLHRDFHTAVTIKDKIIVFGGRTPEWMQTEVNFYEFNISKKQWRLVKPTGYSPGPRNHLIARIIGHFVIYFGGEATYQWHKSYHNDIFVLDTDNYHCTQIKPSGCLPEGRCNMAACIQSGDLIVFGGEALSIPNGGRDSKTVTKNDLYVLSLLPSLQALCVNNIVQEELDISPLPPKLQNKILKTMKSS